MLNLTRAGCTHWVRLADFLVFHSCRVTSSVTAAVRPRGDKPLILLVVNERREVKLGLHDIDTHLRSREPLGPLLNVLFFPLLT